MGAALFIAFVFFGKITWPLFYAVVTIIWRLIEGLIRTLTPDKKEKKKAPKKTKQEAPEDPPPVEAKSLPFEQKVIFCTNIIEDAYSYKDYFLDELYEGTEHPVFSVPDCLNYSESDFKAQFSGGKWEDAWVDALSLAFGVSFENLGKGCFAADNVK